MNIPLFPLNPLLFDPQEIQYIFPQIPRVLALPGGGTWSISYDIYTRPTEDPPPDGWGSYRAATYKQIIKFLKVRGFERHQYSDYRRENVLAIYTYMTLLALRYIPPLGKFSSTVKGVKMHHIADMPVEDQSDALQLGGPLGLRLLGPTPANLVPVNVPGAVPVGADAHALPPRYTRRTPESLDPNNWLM